MTRLRSLRGWRRVLAAATAVQALLTILSAFTPAVPWRVHVLEALEPSSIRGAGQVLTLAGGAVLLALLPGLVRGERRATARTVAILYALVALHAAKGLDYEEGLLALALALLMRFGAPVDGARGRPSAGAAAGALALVGLMGAFATELAIYSLGGPDLDVGSRFARDWYQLLTGAAAPGSGPWADVVWALVGLALVGGLVAVVALLRPVRADHGHTRADHEAAARIVARWGDDTLAPFALRQDKAYFFARGGLVAYRTLRETVIVSGDPVGPPDAVPDILADFAAFAARQGWDVVVTAASARHLDAYRQLGLHVVRIGSEAVVDPARFTLEGRAVRKLRQSVTRAERRGWSVEVVTAGDLDGPRVEEIAALERAWHALRPRLAGFAMAMDRLWGAPEDAQDVYVLARGPDGSLGAFLRFVRHGRGLSLDAMRRLDDTPNGLTEACVAAILARAREHGLHEVSLNFAGFAHLMAADAALGPGQRCARRALHLAHARFQLDRLVTFNEKFAPEWRPRYVVHSSRRRLPLAGLRVLQAEGYVRPPRGPRAAPAPAPWQPAPLPVGVIVPGSRP